MGKAVRYDIHDLEAVQRMLDKAAALDIDEIKQALGATLEDAAKERFETKQSPEGTPWADWSPRYAERAGQDTRRSLLMGPRPRLARSISFEVRSDGIYVGSTMVYARAHQEGYPKRNLPARPYLGIGDQDVEDMVGTIERLLHEEAGIT